MSDASAPILDGWRSWFRPGPAALGIAATVVVVVAFTLVVVQPFSGPPKDLGATDVAVQWNQSIAHFGITPVFPPQEDFHVGDVLAIVARTDATGSPILGRAVFIAHLDLRATIVAAQAGLPVFAETAAMKTGDEFRQQDSTQAEAPSSDKIRLSLLAFPGVSISHTARSGSGAGAGPFGFGAGREDTSVEELRIPTAETYGVLPSTAAVRLLEWCGDPRTKINCTDAYARRMLAFTLGDEVMAKGKDGAYTSTLQLQIVTRVYLTRSIEQRRMQSGSRAVTVLRRGSAAEAPAAATTGSPGGAKVVEAATARSDSADAASAIETGATLRTAGADSTEFQMLQTFQRPLVFGFRSWNMRLKP